MKVLLFISLIILIKGQEEYEENEEEEYNEHEEYERLISEKVSEKYCNDVISNLTSILDDAYIYLDFIKAPKQPAGYDNYIPKVDLIKELNDINKKDRYFYDFYRDIKKVLEKTRDGRLYFSAFTTPNNYSLEEYYFCIPFKYTIKEIFNKENKVNDTFLTIESVNSCKNGYSNETIEKIEKLEGKKINKINDISPYEYLEEMGKKFDVAHSPQARYIIIISHIHNLYIDVYPFKKEELNISIEFEENELLQLEYQFKKLKFYNKEFKKYFLEEKKKLYKGFFPILDFEQLELKYKIKKGIISKKIKKDINWDMVSEDETIKCKVDEKNKYNVIYQISFSPENFYDYEEIMEQCFSEFYSNDYNIIIIEDRNGGGYPGLCVPFTQYLRPKISKPDYSAIKNSEINLEYFANYYQVLNPETCLPFTDKDKLLEGIEDKYSEEVIHKKSKIFDNLDVYDKKNMDKIRKEYLSTGKIKKPTEIIIFTDGYSFSCTSSLITGLQVHGSAIIVGYNSRPDLNKNNFDASQSNSRVSEYKNSEFINNLNNLGFYLSITMEELFDPNDKNNPKTPFEFLVNPVDEIVPIYKKYDDEIYDRFINEADLIFKKYNDLENGECNPDNKYLFYETNDCDSKINIAKAHGGYLCGTDRKWNKSNCIASYCDEGYILNDERTECIKDLCEEIDVVEKNIKNITKSEEFIIEPKTAYFFYIDDEVNSYYFLSNQDYLMNYYDYDYNKIYINNQTLLKNEDYAYINYYLNISEKTKVLIVNENYNNTDFNYYNSYSRNFNKKKGLATWKFVLIVIGIILFLILATLISIFRLKKCQSIEINQVSNSNINLNKI